MIGLVLIPLSLAITGVAWWGALGFHRTGSKTGKPSRESSLVLVVAIFLALIALCGLVLVVFGPPSEARNIGEALGTVAVLNIVGIGATAIGISLAARSDPSRLASLAFGSSAAMLVGFGGVVWLARAMTDPLIPQPPIGLLSAFLTQPIMSGVGAFLVASWGRPLFDFPKTNG